MAPTFSVLLEIVEIVEDDVGGRSRSLPPSFAYTPPSGSSTYGSVKTYTGHRPRIIFRSRTRERRMCVRAEYSIPTTGEDNLSCCEKETTWRTEKSRSAVVSAKLGQSQSRATRIPETMLRYTKTYKALESSPTREYLLMDVSYFSLLGAKYPSSCIYLILKYRFFKEKFISHASCAFSL